MFFKNVLISQVLKLKNFFSESLRERDDAKTPIIGFRVDVKK